MKVKITSKHYIDADMFEPATSYIEYAYGYLKDLTYSVAKDDTKHTFIVGTIANASVSRVYANGDIMERYGNGDYDFIARSDDLDFKLEMERV